MKTVIHQFTRDDRGGVAVAAAGFMAVGVAFIGAAITYSQAASTRTSYQRALDAAVIAGALLPTSATEGDRKATLKLRSKDLSASKPAMRRRRSPRPFRLAVPAPMTSK